MDIPGTSSDFLDSLLGNNTDFLGSLLNNLPMPVIPVEPIVPVQGSVLLSLPETVLDQILNQISLKERVLSVAATCRTLRERVKKSITSVEFYKEELDSVKENSLKYFLHVYGEHITHLNFDLFRSSFIEETSQWPWRQSVVSSAIMCKNLRELSVLVCNRHRLRDNDLITIFAQSPHLKALSVDAQFISGHCFQKAPVELEKLELEMCYRITDTSMKTLGRLKNLKVLHMSELLVLKDLTIHGILNQLQKLEDLSIVSHQDTIYHGLTAPGLAMLGKLRNLKCLALEGLSVVTDRFLAEFGDSRNPVVSNLRSLSLAFCFNFSGVGLQRLAQFSSLQDLNLEGCAKRDISMGLEAIARGGRLIRLLLAEQCNVSPATLLRVLYNSKKLRLLDITSNEGIVSWESANTLIHNWAQTGLHQLTVLTDRHVPWNMVLRPEPNKWGVLPIRVVHVQRSLVPMCEVMPGSVLSDEQINQLPPGTLSPRLRRGNRYRMLFSALGPCTGGEEKENSSPQKRDSGEHLITNPLLHIPNDFCAPLPQNGPPPFGNVANAISPRNGQLPNMMQKEAFYMNGPMSPLSGMQNPVSFGCPPLFPPNASDLSLEMLTMLMGLEDPSLSLAPPGFESPPPGLERRSGGGAPRPPVEVPQQPKLHYTRGPRAKRRSLGVKKTQNEVRFDEADFPPLS